MQVSVCWLRAVFAVVDHGHPCRAMLRMFLGLNDRYGSLALVHRTSRSRPGFLTCRCSPIPFSYIPPFARHDDHADSNRFAAPTTARECAHTLLHPAAIARIRIRAAAAACHIRRSHACRYFPTIAHASHEHRLSHDRCNLHVTLEAVINS